MKETSKKPLVLLVDADLAFCRAVKEDFLALGYEVETASTFEDATEAINASKSVQVVVFVDLKIPHYIALMSYLRMVADQVVVYVWTDGEASTVRAKVFTTGGLEVFSKNNLNTLELVPYIEVQAVKELRLRSRSDKDMLTGVYTFQAFTRIATNELRAAVNRLSHQVISLLLIDVDKLKQLNDVHGYFVANDVLAAIGSTLNEHIRHTSDYAGRMGGDEFLILLTDTDEDTAFLTGEKLQREVASILVAGRGGEPIQPSISFGVGSIHRHEIGDVYQAAFLELIQRADLGPRGLKERRAYTRR